MAKDTSRASREVICDSLLKAQDWRSTLTKVRSYGATNILINLDEKGFEITHYDVSARASGRNAVSPLTGNRSRIVELFTSDTEIDVGDEAGAFRG